MDTKKLVVGQDVYMVSGVYASRGTVVEVTPSGVIVDPGTKVDTMLVTESGVIMQPVQELRYFDTTGKACDNYWTRYDTYSRFDIRYMSGTYECGPWELTDAP